MKDLVCSFIGNTLLHLGWALFGQECECETTTFNWLAKMMPPDPLTDEEIEASWRFRLGSFFTGLANDHFTEWL